MDLNRTFARLADDDTITLEPSWAQGRALFGGLSGGLMLAKLQHTIDRPRRLRSLTVSFVGPIDTSGEIGLQAQILRVGKSVLQGEVHLTQNGGVQAVLLASFGEARESAARIAADSPPPAMPQVGQIPAIPAGAPDMPAFLQHFDIRWAHGPLPFSGSTQAEFGGYLRFRGQEGAFTLPHLVTLTDAFPPAVVTLLPQPAPASSLTWTLELLHDPDGADMADFWQYRVRTDYAADGYGHTEARIWDKNGRLTLISRQTVTVFG
ncbi:thioesterase family protein [Neisseria leonii]|uniref:Thioesterase family protein n=1 Tax=Neisseria leonii TaxID=2995413 RepID=A0A9X4ID43_9NEIS|nr:thioesterase family protein [Neisseria sp. 51.81]MDD9327326.1 thioesterase family protein [Neisseria sp. 51.81]